VGRHVIVLQNVNITKGSPLLNSVPHKFQGINLRGASVALASEVDKKVEIWNGL